MPLSQASQAEIIRSNQKDEYYLGFLRSSLTDLVHSWLGPAQWLTWRRELDVAAELLYFGLTTLGGYQTLGEEYVSLIQTDGTRRQIPSLPRRMLMVGLQSVAPHLLQSLISHTERHLRTCQSLTLSPATRGQILKALPILSYTLTHLQRCHLVAFYINGAFYHIAKRLSNVNYVRVSGANRDSGSTLVYRTLGVLSLLQLILTAIHHIHTLYHNPDTSTPVTSQTRQTSKPRDEEELSAGVRCSLCLEQRVKTTATPCGHLYCWSCIHEWCSTKTQCPICRQECLPSRLIYLRNYDKS